MNNKSCILTVIKNEHEYLDEWIRYHLDLGIDHIFIFEDFDSYSHRKIVNKYPTNKVTLKGILSIFNKDEQNDVINKKLTKNGHPQLEYIKKCLSYIKNEYKEMYDWCFVIDNDEFLTLNGENVKTLDDIFSLYSGYDAFIIWWKCYGANGYINKPDYKDKGVVGTYTKEVSLQNIEKYWQCKTCYNLDKFTELTFGDVHHPKNECKWCATNFETSETDLVYDNIYIRHYITKSFDEYIWKQQKRGFFMGISRMKDGFFFAVNPDLKNKQNELLKKVEEKKTNSCCILTIIKNEHEYLDEWIKYHLCLGIDHIFIFEDMDSESHKDITNKYSSDKVTLKSITSVLDENKIKEAIDIKKTQKYSVQHFYLRNAVSYVKNEYQNKYKWCFLIDNDEFITLENENDNISDVLSLYNDYEALLLRWKCYGANGYIKKPSYDNGGLIETYTKEIENVYDAPRYHNKTCYKLSTYQNSFIKSSHHYPNNECNFCNTNFVKSLEIPSYKNIYLRHYITKSWEEFVWKKTQRGFMLNRCRNIDSFFIFNKDLANKKDELIKSLHKDTLVVLPYKQNGSQGNEIKLALKGWKKFCQFDYHFVVIGEFDNSLKVEFPWAEFIECKTLEKKENQYNPHLDIQNKMEVVMRKYDKMYDGFIWMVDDNYAIKPFDLKNITDVHYHSSNFTGRQDQPTSYWNHDKWKTKQLLNKFSLSHYNYTTHYPCYFEFKKLKEIWDKFNMRKESYVLEDIYFNYFQHKEPILDSEIRLGIWNKKIWERYTC